jgi:hypothetical protein
MKFSKYCFDRLKFIIIVLCSSLLFIVLYNIFFPTVAFAIGPEEIIDHYGNIEYVGKDPYGHFHNYVKSGGNNIVTSQDISKVGDQYGSNPPYERD